MPLTHTKDLFAKAVKGKYALGAFNVNNMELLQAIIEACEEEKAPVMLLGLFRTEVARVGRNRYFIVESTKEGLYVEE